MSWFSKNYEKAALGGAVVVALGLAYLGWSKFGGVDEDFGAGLKGAGNNNTAVAGADLIPKALQSMKLDRTVTQALDGERPVDLFTGIALFIKSSEPEKPVDPIKDAPIHPPDPQHLVARTPSRSRFRRFSKPRPRFRWLLQPRRIQRENRPQQRQIPSGAHRQTHVCEG